jgi:hypothetical protein
MQEPVDFESLRLTARIGRFRAPGRFDRRSWKGVTSLVTDAPAALGPSSRSPQPLRSCFIGEIAFVMASALLWAAGCTNPALTSLAIISQATGWKEDRMTLLMS